MKKLVLAAVFVFLFVFSVPHATAGEVRLDSVLGLNNYVPHFREAGRLTSPGTMRVETRFFQDRDNDMYRQIAGLDDNPNSIDNSLELVLAMQYTAAVNIRPPEAVEILPAGRPSDIRLELPPVRWTYS